MIDLHRAGAPSDYINAFRGGIGIVEVERFRRDLIAKREDREDRLQAAGGTEQMAGGRLG